MSRAHHKKYQNDSKAEFTGCQSETESDSDSAEGTEGKDKVSVGSVIYSVEILVAYGRLQNQLILKSQRKSFVSNICTHCIYYLHQKIYHFKHFA